MLLKQISALHLGVDNIYIKQDKMDKRDAKWTNISHYIIYNSENMAVLVF